MLGKALFLCATLIAAMALKRRVEAGESFDVIVPGPDLIKELVAQRKDAMRPKLRPMPEGAGVGALERGEVDLVATGSGAAVGLRGYEVVGPLPREVQSYVNFSIGVAADSTSGDAARALMRYLTSAGVAQAFAANGLERIDQVVGGVR
jgi:hypothetical protein